MIKTSGVHAMLIAASLMAAARAQASTSQAPTLAISPQSLVSALEVWAEQTGWQLLYDSEVVLNQQSNGAPEGLPATAALARVLDGTGLIYRYLNERTISIFPSAAGPQVPRAYAASMHANADRNFDGDDRQTEDGPSDTHSSDQDRAASKELTEVIVTAQKRGEERLQDVPLPITVVSGASLANSNQVSLQDFYSKIPGVAIAPWFGSYKISIRGIMTEDFKNPTVANMIDDIPHGSSLGEGGGLFAPDIDPGDLAQVEVLRGPQGTLYGASSLGGLLRYVTVDPSTERLSGRVQVGLSGVKNGNEVGHNVRGAVNVPLSNTWAVRASGFTRREPGYIDDPTHDLRAINPMDSWGGRLSALWRPSEDFSLKLSAMRQDRTLHGSNNVSPTAGDLEQPFHLPGLDAGFARIWSFGGILNAKLGRANLTSISGYSDTEIGGGFSFEGVSFLANLAGFPGRGVSLKYSTVPITKFSQELRVAIPLTNRVDWQIGGFYTHEDSDTFVDISAVERPTGAVAGPISLQHSAVKYEEYAAFTNLTFKLTDRFDVQLGGRQGHHTLTFGNNGAIYFADPPIDNTIPEFDGSGDAFTYMFTPRFKVTSDLMLYARIASGYRPGGPNSAASLGLCSQCSVAYDPDRTYNYEIGMKGSSFGNVLSFDTSLYYIDWKEIQLSGRENLSDFIFNGGRAKSQGLELSVEVQPFAGLSVSVWGVLSEAELTEDLPPEAQATGIAAFSGDRLPFSSRRSGGLTLRQEFPFGVHMRGFVEGAISYIGERLQGFSPADIERIPLPSYTKTDLRVGAKHDRWSINAYANNLTDKRAAISDNAVYRMDILPPRTFGLQITTDF